MRFKATALAVLASTVALAGAASAQARLPKDFFGIVPQTPITEEDTNRMRHGGVDTIRIPLSWGALQPSQSSPLDWNSFDHVVAAAARSNIDVLPVLEGVPRWLVRRPNRLPVASGVQRRGWAAFVSAAVQRYGPGGQFWREHWAGSSDPVPSHPIRRWQVWNEENFFFFTKPASPGRYARFLKITSAAIKGVYRRADVLIGGLFGDPKGRPPKAMDAAPFLDRLYRVRGIKRSFDGVALHPYAANVRMLARLSGAVRGVMIRHGDRRSGLYITEMGWGSKRNPRRVAFEIGWRAQAEELRRAYLFLIRQRRSLNLKQVHWFTWKDVLGSCGFCDSSGLFRRGSHFRSKPAWHMFSAIARGRLR
jgi:polysaccharide biosynthesis protein PslG